MTPRRALGAAGRALASAAGALGADVAEDAACGKRGPGTSSTSSFASTGVPSGTSAAATGVWSLFRHRSRIGSAEIAVTPLPERVEPYEQVEPFRVSRTRDAPGARCSDLRDGRSGRFRRSQRTLHAPRVAWTAVPRTLQLQVGRRPCAERVEVAR